MTAMIQLGQGGLGLPDRDYYLDTSEKGVAIQTKYKEYLAFLLTEAGGQSFPSGHSFNSAVIYIAIALAFAAMSPRRSVRCWRPPR